MLDGRKSWITGKNVPKDRVVHLLFRKTFRCEQKPEGLQVHVSADSRYKLYVNDHFVEAGPCKGDNEIWYYDTLELASYLQEGNNVIAVEVLSYPAEHGKGSFSIFRTGHPGMFLDGQLACAGEKTELSADETWKVWEDTGYEIVKESDFFAPLQVLEKRSGEKNYIHWKRNDYDDSGWENAVLDRTFSAERSPGNLNERPIPFLYRKEKRFTLPELLPGETVVPGLEVFLAGNGTMTVEAGKKISFEISAGEEETGYLHLLMAGGGKSRIQILTSEGYVQDGFQGALRNPYKKDRLDRKNGHLHGFTDSYETAGNGTEESPEEYTPFWFRTFRFIRIEIETGENPLTLLSLSYTETGYPLEVKTNAWADDPDFAAIWDISERTLRRCMHETYEDCPFYEQLQYVMDARTQILYTYVLSGDDRLARKCMEDIRRSQRYDGLTNSSHPNYETNVIPCYSIYYILMLYDHMMYFGDKKLLRDHLPNADRVLGFFHNHLTEKGYVDKIGGINGWNRFWSFVDWTPQWERTSGVPKITLQGPITMESLLYIYGLQAAEKIASYLGLSDLAGNYEKEYRSVQNAVRTYLMGERGMLADGPGAEEYSQHVQVFAILTDTVGLEEGKEALLRTIREKEEYPQCSVAMAFYLFRALEKTGLYEYTKEYWGIWRRMLAKHTTTCIEDETQERSDCHAWGALLLYELPAVILGVRPEEPGFQKVSVKPVPGYLKEAGGTVLTPAGKLQIQWKKDENGEIQLVYQQEKDEEK